MERKRRSVLQLQNGGVAKAKGHASVIYFLVIRSPLTTVLCGSQIKTADSGPPRTLKSEAAKAAGSAVAAVGEGRAGREGLDEYAREGRA